jgi:hypothetical protein
LHAITPVWQMAGQPLIISSDLHNQQPHIAATAAAVAAVRRPLVHTAPDGLEDGNALSIGPERGQGLWEDME